MCVFDEKMEASEKSVCARGLNKGYWENKYLFDKEITKNIDLSEKLCSKKRQTLLENCKKVAPGKKENRYFEKPSLGLLLKTSKIFIVVDVSKNNIVFILFLKKQKTISHCTNHRVSGKI